MAKTKKRVLSLLMAAVMMLSALPMNAYAIDWSGVVGDLVGSTIGELVCEKEEVGHTAECYVHTDACKHSHSEPVYAWGALIFGCEYAACTAHTHSTDIGCPVENCDAHAHDSDCCNVEEYKHGVLCYSLKQKCSHGWQVWKCNDSCYETVLTCTKTEHDHTSGCNYTCGISTEHTHDADCYSCEIVEHTHDADCARLCGKDGQIDSVKCALQSHELSCTNELHHKHTLEDGCYMSTEAVQNAVFKATGVVIEDPVELGAVLSTIVKCMTNSGACHVDYDVIAVEPYLDLALVLCEEHFCSICHRLNVDYCTCVELTFTNIYNVADNSVTVKVAAGTAAGAVAPHADMTDYQFMGWFDANGNEFNTETVYTEDTTFTASYRELGEAEKLMNTIEFIKNNFDLGTEIGRIITMLTNGEVNKEKFLSEKETALDTINKALLTAKATGLMTGEQVDEIYSLMTQGDEYVVMVAEWLWPNDAVEMPNLEEILANIDREKLAAEIKAMIAEYYGVEFTEEWINENRALAEQYIRECLREVKSISDAHKAAILEQLAQEKAEAIEFVNAIRNEMREQIKAEIENAKDAVKEVLANRELGLKLGKLCKAVGLNADKLSNKSTLALAALKTVISNSGIPTEQKNGLLSLMKSGDNGMAQIIAWMFPTYTVNFVVDGKTVETDVVEHGTMPSFDGEIPTKAADAQYTYTFGGWDKEFSAVTENVTYTANFDSIVNEYTITFVDEDGEFVWSGEFEYGTTPVFGGTEPTKAGDAQYTYTFAGWTPAVVAVTGEATYTATYAQSTNEYVVKFVNWNGTELQSGAVAYGETPAYTGETPTKEATAQYTYTFAGWDPEISAVTGAVTYTATFADTVNKYTVTFVDKNGTELQSSEVEYGTAATAPEAPVVENYEFTGWDKDFSNVVENMTVTAVYDQTHHNSKTLKVNIGYNAKSASGSTAGNIHMSPDGKKFVGEIYDVLVTKLAAPSKDAIIATLDYENGDVYYGYSNGTETFKKSEMNFTGFSIEEGYLDNVDWDNISYVNATGIENPEASDYFRIYRTDFVACKNGEYHMDNHAKFYHTVTFVVDGNEYKVPVQHGKTVALPEGIDTSKEGYNFKGWDVDFTAEGFVVNESMTITAEYEIIKYKVTFYLPAPIGGKTVVYVDHGDTVQAPEGLNFGENVTFKHWYCYKVSKYNAFDFSTPITQDLEFQGKTEYVLKDREIEYYTVIDGKEVVIGTGTIKNIRVAKGFGTGTVKTKYYNMDQFVLPTEGNTITIDDAAHVYGVRTNDVYNKNNTDRSARNFYEISVKNLNVVCKNGVYSYRAECDVEQTHAVIIYKATGGNELVWVKHGETMEMPTPKMFKEQELIRFYDYRGDKNVDFDFSQPITKSWELYTLVKWIPMDHDVTLVVEYNGQKIDFEPAVFKDSLNARAFGHGALTEKEYDASKIIMPEFEAQLVDGMTYQYGSGADFYTLEFKELWADQAGGYSFRYYGEIKLWHTVYVVVDGKLVSEVVEHGQSIEVAGCSFDNVTECAFDYAD